MFWVLFVMNIVILMEIQRLPMIGKYRSTDSLFSKGKYLTKEIEKRTLTIHQCPIEHPPPYNDAHDWLKLQQLSANVTKSLFNLNIILHTKCFEHFLCEVSICDTFLHRTDIGELNFELKISFHLNRHNFRLLQIKVN